MSASRAACGGGLWPLALALCVSGCGIELYVGDACGPEEALCTVDGATVCVDTASSAAHCGACGRACDGVCREGTCCPSEEPDLCTDASGEATCVDLSSDPAHCGACDVSCPDGSCVDGVCCAGMGDSACDVGGLRTCVDLSVDPAHCGSCNVTCASGLCVQGACCEGGAPATCGDRCVDLAEDPANCGECGRVCPDGVCVGGLCCTETGGTLCRDAGGESRCVDLQRDPAHCGECGSVCPTGACSGGACCSQVCGRACVPTRYDRLEARGGYEGLSARLVDLDGDGLDDALWNMQLDNRIEIHWGNPTGLSDPTWVDTGRIGVGLDVGDVDEDGHLDIVASIQPSGPPEATQIRVFFGDGARSFPRSVAIPQDFNPGWLTLLDADEDGHLDIVVRLMGAGCTALRRGDGAGGFTDAACLFPYATISDSEAIRAGDVDGDGKDELVEYRTGAGPEIRVHRLAGGRVVGTTMLPVTSVITPHIFDLRDVNGDGTEDVVLFEPNGSTTLVRGLWSGGDCLVATLMTSPPPDRPEYIYSAGDFDGDGNIDFVGRITCGFCETSKTLHLGRR